MYTRSALIREVIDTLVWCGHNPIHVNPTHVHITMKDGTCVSLWGNYDIINVATGGVVNEYRSIDPELPFRLSDLIYDMASMSLAPSRRVTFDANANMYSIE